MPTASTPMPARRPRIAHFTPSWRGDRPAALHQLAAKPPERRFIDQNYQAVRHGRSIVGVNLHWRDPLRNGYRFILDTRTGRVRRMTRAELRRPVDRWTLNEVLCWRRPTRNRRGRRTGWDRPHTYSEMTRLAVRCRVTICAELKHPAFRDRQAARDLVEQAHAAGHPAWFTRLYSLGYVPEIAAAVRDGGGYLAVIFGRFQTQRRAYAAARARWAPGTRPSATW